MPRILFIFLLALLFNAPVEAQSNSPYIIRTFTTEDGLPSNGIKGLQWDESTGFLWIATEAGVSRYNGLAFTNFTKENTPGLYHERMSFITKNLHGTIYTADLERNIHRVNVNRLQYEPGNKKTRPVLSTYGEVLKHKVALFNSRRPPAQMSNVFQLSDTSLLTRVADTIFYISEKVEAPIPHLLPFHMRALMILNGQAVFIDTERNFYVAKNGFNDFETVALAYPDGQPFTYDKSDQLVSWNNGMNNAILFSGGNAWLLSYRNNRIEVELVCSGIPASSFFQFAQYSEKNKTLFIGTDSKGVIIISPRRLLSVKNTEQYATQRNAYYSQVELPNGNILTNEGHVLGVGTKQNAGSLPIKGKFDFNVYRTGDSLLWYTQVNLKVRDDVLHLYNLHSKETTVFPNIRTPQSFAIDEKNGTYYIVTSSAIGKLRGDSLEVFFNTKISDYTSSAPNAMTWFSPDILGVASCSGLVLYNFKTRTVDTLIKRSGICIRSLFRYKEYVFIGSYGGGFYIWKNGILKPMPLDKNKFLLYTHCFIPDSAGYCWISSNRGLFKAQLSDLIDAFENNTRQVYYHYFGKNDGMEITEMNGGCQPCALAMKSGTYSFPTMDGLLWVDPKTTNPQLPEGNIFIDEFRVNGRLINPDSLNNLRLPAASNDILIRLGFSSWCNKENIYLEYRLNDNEWIPVNTDNGGVIHLNNLPKGKYVLHVRKLNGFGVNNYSFKEIRFSIATPWYEQTWFYILAVLLAGTIIVLYFRYRTSLLRIRQRKLERQVDEKTKELQEKNDVLEKNDTIKTRLISIISHDIVTPLKFLTTAGKNLQEKRSAMPEELQEETIKEMTNTSQELQLLSTNILNWIKYQNENRRMVKENFDLREMVNQVFGILQSLARQKDLLIRNEVPADLQVYQYYEPVKILVYNLMTNAIHFTEKGSIIVTAVKENGSVIVAVKDEGIGMTPEQIQRLMAEEMVITSANVDNKRGHGLGFLIIKDLVKTMEATLTIESKKEEGSTIAVKMPATKSGN